MQLQVQEQLLDEMVRSSANRKGHTGTGSCPTRCFSRVESRLRAELKKVPTQGSALLAHRVQVVDRDALQEIESQVASFAASELTTYELTRQARCRSWHSLSRPLVAAPPGINGS